MPDTVNSANMGFGIPIVSQDQGPQWASDLNAALIVIDQHTHAPRNGLPVATIGININSDLPFNNNNATSVKTVRFGALGSPASSGTDIGCIYVSGQDLYFNDLAGNRIQITRVGSVISSSGNITNLAPPASVTYLSGSATFVFQSSATVAASIDVGNVIIRNLTGGANGVTIQAAPTTPNWTLTLPNGAGSNRSSLRTDGSGNAAWYPNYSPSDALNYGFTTTVASSALTISLKGFDGNDPSSSNPVEIVFRNATTGTGTPVVRTVTVPTSAVITSSLGLATLNLPEYLYVSALDNSGVVELAYMGGAQAVDPGAIQSTVAEGGASSARTRYQLYSTVARTSVPVKPLARMKFTLATSGVWNKAADEIFLNDNLSVIDRSELVLTTGNGLGAVSTAIRRFTTVEKSVGAAISYPGDNANLGAVITIMKEGTYAIVYTDFDSTGTMSFGVSLNSNELTTSIGGIIAATRLSFGNTSAANNVVTVTAVRRLVVGDILRPHTSVAGNGTTSCKFSVTRLGD